MAGINSQGNLLGGSWREKVTEKGIIHLVAQLGFMYVGRLWEKTFEQGGGWG